jgi:hypothetical protein
LGSAVRKTIWALFSEQVAAGAVWAEWQCTKKISAFLRLFNIHAAPVF